MTIEVYIIKNVGILVISAQIFGAPEATEVPDKVKNLISNGIKNIILDLSAAKAINSVGIGTLLECLSSVKRAGGELNLAAVSDKIMEILQRTEVKQLFDIFESVEAALFSIQNNPEKPVPPQ